MRVLVTGHRGFLGRHLAAACAKRGWDVDGRDVSDGTRQDVRMTLAYCGRYDLVLHCAALVGGRATIEGAPAALAAYNLQLDGALFQWALQTRPRRLVYFSSSAAYPTNLQDGNPPRRLAERLVVDHPANPDALYGWVKLTGERVAGELRRAGVPTTVVRPFSGYGTDQNDRYPFPAIMARARARQDPFEVWGDGRQVRDFVHVDDVAEAVLTLVDREADGPVNVGTGVGTSMTELATLAMRATGYAAPIRYLRHKPQGVCYRVADPSLLRLYYKPRVSLEEGVSRALEACGDVRMRLRPSLRP